MTNRSRLMNKQISDKPDLSDNARTQEILKHTNRFIKRYRKALEKLAEN